jgi:predicted RND superfamily exporter protein
MSTGRGTEDRLSRYLHWLDRRRRLVLIASALVCLACATSLIRLRLDADPLGTLPAGRTVFQEYRNYLARFGGHSALVALVDAPDEATVIGFGQAYAQRLATLSEIAVVRYRFDPLAFSREVLGRYLPSYLTEDEIDRIRPRLEPTAIVERVRGLRAALMLPGTIGAPAFIQHDPLGLLSVARDRLAAESAFETMDPSGLFLSQDRQALLIIARPRTEIFDVDVARHLLAECRNAATALAAERPEWHDVRVSFTGGQAHVLNLTATVTRDMLIYTTLAPLVILGAFHMAYRNLAILPFVSYPLICGMLVTFAGSQLIYDRLDLISLTFTAIFYGLAIDAGIHFYTRLLQEGRRNDPMEAMYRTLRALGPTHLVASATTAAVFAVLGLSHIRGVAQLGILTAIAMLANIASMVVIFPVLLFSLSRRFPDLMRPAATLDTPRLGRITAWCGRQRWGFLTVLVILGASSLVASQGIRLDTDFRRLRPADSEPTRTEDEIAARFGFRDPEGAIITEGATLDAALARAEDVAAVLRSYGPDLVASIRSPTALLPPVATQERRWAAWRRLPRAEAAAALRNAMQGAGFRTEAFTGYFELLARDEPDYVLAPDPARTLPRALETALDLHVREHAGRFYTATFVQPAPGSTLSDLAVPLRADLERNGSPGYLSGRQLMEHDLHQVLGRELRLFTGLGLLANMLIVWAAFRSMATTVAIMIPPVLVVSLFLAALHLAGVALSPITIVVLPLALGISVDDCVYLAERHQAGALLDVVGTHGGRAVVMSTITTMVGFGFLAFSRFPGLAELGTLTAGAIGLALIAAFTVLPVCINTLCTRREPERP